jgi:hypothetical protein
MLDLYSATLLGMFVRSKNLLLESLGHFMYRITSYTNGDNLFSSIPICIPLLLSLCLLLWVRIQALLFDKSDNNDHSSLIPVFRGNASSFSSFSTMLAVGLSYVDFTRLNLLSFLFLVSLGLLS